MESIFGRFDLPGRRWAGTTLSTKSLKERYSHPEETPSFLNYGSIQNYARALRHRGNGENPRFRPPRENYGYAIF